MNRIKIILPLICACCCLSLQAAAGFADAFNDRQHWIYPAYLYNLFFGVIVLLGLWSTTMIWKSRTKLISGNISVYLRDHPIMAIISVGLLLSIPFALCVSLMWEIIWFLSIIPTLGIIILFPFLLINKRCREKWILSPCILKWLIMFVIACCISTLLFIALTNVGVLPNTDITYLARPDRFHPNFYCPTHPFDSVKEIWSPLLFFVVGIVIALGVFGLGRMKDYLCHKVSAIRHRKRETFIESQ